MIAAIFLEDTCCFEFIVRVHDTDLQLIYLEKRRWTVDGSGVTFDKWRRDENPNAEDLYKWIDENSKLLGISQDTEKWADRNFDYISDQKVKEAKAYTQWIVELSKQGILKELTDEKRD